MKVLLFVLVLTTQMPPRVVNERRFLVAEVVKIPDPTPVRDQLWAEAVVRFRAGGALVL